MLYIWLKYLHILSSTVLFGTGIGTASVMLYAYYQEDIKVKAAIYRYVVLVDWFFTGISGIVQPLTGFILVYLAGYALTSAWIMGSIIGYIITAVCWVIVAYLQVKIRNITLQAVNNHSALPQQYDFYFKYWFMLGWPAFFSLLIVFYLMTAKPTF